MNIFNYDFGYDGLWDYGHLLAALVFAIAAVISLRWHWKRWITGVLFVLTAWSVIGYGIVQTVLRINLPLELPTQAFLASGSGQVLDAGAGSGRSALMVLLARPETRVIALDLYAGYYGISDNTPVRLLANARRAGVAERVEALTGDMRSIPLETASVDAAVSAFAIDHLDRTGVETALGEIGRVLRPGGQFLLMVINNDAWIRIAFPFFLHHGYFGPKTRSEWWRGELENAGFTIVETGTRPATIYLLARKPLPEVPEEYTNTPGLANRKPESREITVGVLYAPPFNVTN